MRNDKKTALTREGIRETVGRAMNRRLKDEKTLELLASRGLISGREKISVGEAIALLRLLTELDKPSPGGFEKLTGELRDGEEYGPSAASGSIEINAPEEFLK